MDVMSALLDGPRARGAFVLRSVMNPPWSLRVEDEAPLTLVALVRGGAWVISEHDGPVELGSGDVAVIRGPAPYMVADQPGTAPQVVIGPGQRCATPDGEDLHGTLDLGVRTWGNDPAGSTVMLVATYEHRSQIGRRLLDALPPVIVVPAGDSQGNGHDALVALLGEEIVRDEPGQDVVLDRVVDLLVIAVLRTWLASAEARAPGWYRAQSDPVVGPAVRRLRAEPARAWTVAGLAAEVGVSRAGLARRFTEVVGEPPMAFLTGWRLALAADLLREPTATVGAVARQVGYGSPFALSAAFKRELGVSPRQHRIGSPAA